MEMVNQITNIVNIENKEEIEYLRASLHAAEERAKDLDGVIQMLKDHIEDLENSDGIKELQDQLLKFRKTAIQSAQDLKTYFDSINITDSKNWNVGELEDIFKRVREGVLSYSQAIHIAKTEHRELFEEALRKNDNSLQAADIEKFHSALELLNNTLSSVTNRMDNLEKLASSQFGGNIADTVRKIEEAMSGMSEGAKDAYNSIINLIRALTEYANIDTSKIQIVSDTFKSISDVGNGIYSSDSIDNIIKVTQELQKLAASGANEIKFDYSGITDIASLVESLRVSAEKFAEAMQRGVGQQTNVTPNLNINVGGNKNPLATAIKYGKSARKNIVELREQANELEAFINEVARNDESLNGLIVPAPIYLSKLLASKGNNSLSAKLTNFFVNTKDRYSNVLGIGSDSLRKQMSDVSEFISMIKQASKELDIDISSVTSKFSNDADKLVEDTEKIATGEDDIAKETERLKSIFNNGLNAEDLTKRFEEVVDAINSVVEAIKELSSSLSSIPRIPIENPVTNSEEIEKTASTAAEIYKNAYDKTYNELSQDAKNDLVFNGDTGDLVSTSGAYADAADKLNNLKLAYNDATRAAEQNATAMNNSAASAKQSSSSIKEAADVVEDESDEEEKANKEAILSFQDAKRAIQEYYKVRLDLAKEQRDVELSSDGFESKTGRLNELAAALNRTKTAYDMFTSEEFKQSLSEEQQIELLKLMTVEQEKYAVSVERLTNKALDTEAIRRQNEAFAEAKNIITDYYSVMTKLQTLPNDVIKGENGLFVSKGGEWQGLAGELNRVVERYKKIDELMPMMSMKQQTELTERETQAKGRLNIATEKTAAIMASVDSRVNDSVSVGKSYEAVIGRITRSLSSYSAAEHSKNELSREAYSSLKEEAAALRSLYSHVINTGEGYDELNKKVREADAAYRRYVNIIREAGDDQKSFGDKIGILTGRFAAWFSVSRVIISTYRNIKKMIAATIELDAAMNQLQIVTRESDNVMSKFAETAADASQRIGSSITDFVSSATTFARLGYSLEESAGLAEFTAMLQNVGDIDVSDAQDAITAIIKAFGKDVDEIESVMDKLVVVGNNFPISVSQIAEGMNNASSTLAAAGNSFEQSVALLTAANTTMQDAAKASTGLRTITARIRNTKTELDDLGEVMTEAKYNEVVQALTKYNISLTDLNGEYRSTYDILADIAGIWDKMTSMEQAAMATNLAGTRQQAVFYSIINNFQEASGAMDAMSSSAGALKSAYDVYLESVTAHINQFKAAFQELSYSVASSGTINWFVDLGTAILKLVNALQRVHATLPIISLALTAIATARNKNAIEKSIVHVNSLAKQLIKEKTVTDTLSASIARLTEKQRNQLKVQIENAVLSKELTRAEADEIIATIGLSSAEELLDKQNKKTAISFKMLTASIPVWGWVIMGVSALVTVFQYVAGAVNESKKSLEELTESLRQQREEIQNISNEYRNTESSLNDIIPKFIKLSKGVNEFGDKVDLTDEEYAEFVSLNNQIADMFPKINLGIDDTGKAMLALSYRTDTLTNSLKDLLDMQRQMMFEQIADKMPEYLKTISETQDRLNKEIEDRNSKINKLNELKRKAESGSVATFYEKTSGALLDELGINYSKYTTSAGMMLEVDPGDIDTTRIDNYIHKLEKYNEGAKDRIAEIWRTLNPVVSAWLKTDYIYQELNEKMRVIAEGIIKGIDFESLGLNTQDKIKTYIEANILEPLSTSSEDVQSAFAKVVDWQDQLKNGEITFEQFKEYVKNAFTSLKEEFEDDDTFVQQFISGFNAAGIAGSTWEEVVDGIINEWGKLNDASEDDRIIKRITTLADAIDRLKSAYDLISKAKDEMASGGISSDTIKSLISFIDKYNETFDDSKDYLDYLYEENGVIKLNIDAMEDLAKLEMQNNVKSIENEIAALKEEKKVLDDIKEVGDQYNSFVNGNVDYNKRPFISPEKMHRSGWSDFDGDIATTYSQAHTIGDGEFLYTVEVTPILEDGTVLTPEELEKYVNNLITDGGVDTILESDEYKIVINIQEGDYDEEYWNKLEDKLSRVKNKHEQIVNSAGMVSETFGKDLTNAIDNNSAAIDENQKKLEIYQAIFDSMTKSIERTIGMVEGAIRNVDAMSSGFDKLDKMYADVLDKENFDFASLIDKDFIETFSDYDEAFENFIATVSNSPKDITACQDAFNKLVTEYIRGTFVLDNLTDETRNLTVMMLEQMGVANAAELVDRTLAIQKERLAYSTEVYKNMTLEEVQALYNECEAGTTTKQVLAELVLEKMNINANTIKTAADIDNVIALANAAHVSTQSLNNLTAAKIAFQKADAAMASGKKLIEQLELYGDQSAYAEANKLFARAKQFQLEAEELLNKPIEYNPFDSAQFVAKYVGGTTTQSTIDRLNKEAEKAQKQAEKAESWFEKQYKLHQHLLAMDAEEVDDYLHWLNDAYKRAYKEGIITLDDFYKYQEEVYDKLRELFNDYISDTEHEISMREEFEGESKKILELYKQLIKDVEKEIKAARSYGLDDTDDYIQSLQKKWAEYRDAIKDIEDDITNNAKDAIDELVDIRIKMLKQDIADEKEALKKKLEYLKDFYQKQKDMLQDSYDEEKYLEEQSEKRKAVSDIRAELAQLEYDNSAKAQKKKLQLAEDLANTQKELDDFEKEHALKAAQEELDKIYEIQEKEINAQIDLLDEQEDNAKELYERALEDIKNGSVELYNEMIKWNDVYGDGISETITTAWEDAYVALKNYKDLYGTLYNGVNLANATGYTGSGESWDTASVSGTNPANKNKGNFAVYDSSISTVNGGLGGSGNTTSKSSSSSAASTASSVSVDDMTKQRVAAAIWNGGYGWGRGKERANKLIEVFGENNGIQALVNANVGRNGPKPGQEYTYLNMRKKLRGYASGTSNALAGLHSIDELGTETIFQSSDGTRYKMFTGGEKVLNASASNFLYNFATNGKEILSKIFNGALGNAVSGINSPITANEIRMGDIIINGNADKSTVSEIRRAQRDAVESILKEFNRLNK